MLSLLKGDCLDVMKSLPDRSVDCFVCDLPYGCLTNQKNKDGSDGKSKGGKHFAAGKDKRKRFIDGVDTGTIITSDVIGGCDWDVKIDLNLFWEQVKRLSRNDHTPVLMFCNTKFGAELIASNPKWFRYDLVWNKMRGVSFLSANKMPMRSHELIYVFSKKGAYYKRIDIEGDFKKSVAKNPRRTIQGQTLPNKLTDNTGRRCVLSVIESDGYATREKGQHPTAKPEELYKWLLERYCPEDGTMLDPTSGSFNSCWVAKTMGLKAIGIEKDPVFFWKGVKRIGI